MTHDTHAVLAILEHALAVTHDVVLDGPFVGDDDDLAVDLCCMLAATDLLLRRYREALCDIQHDIPF